MKYDSTLLIKVDKETKGKMSKVKVNWSEIIREAIKSELAHQRNLAKAVALTAKVFARHQKSKSDSTSVIRYWREHRYGPNSR